MKKLSYGKLSLDAVLRKFNLTVIIQTIFSSVPLLFPSEILQTLLKRAVPLALISEKSRSEFIIAPILLEIRELSQERISIYSGVIFDVAPEEGLQGICDFLITQSPPLPIIQAPIIVVVEAKKSDIESGLGQCAAEMVAAARINHREHHPDKCVYGCVTTGELWQFLRLDNSCLAIDPQKIYLEHLDQILGVFWKIITETAK